MLEGLFDRHCEVIERKTLLDAAGMEEVNSALRRMERFWTDQIRYIY